MDKLELVRGDYIRVGWVDITEDVTGDPDKPELAVRHSIGQFWDYRTIEGHLCLVTTTTEDKTSHDSGYCCYPLGCVFSIEVIKKRRATKRTKRSIRQKHDSNSGGERTKQVGTDSRETPKDGGALGAPDKSD